MPFAKNRLTRSDGYLLRRGLAPLVLATVLAAAPRAYADGTALPRFDPAEAGSDWFALDSLDLRGHGVGRAADTFDYALHPFVLSDARGHTLARIVSGQAFLHLGGNVNLFDRLRIGLNVPIVLADVGGSAFGIPGPHGAALGDVRLSSDLRIYGAYRSPLTLAVGISVALPTGAVEAYTGDGSLRITAPRLQVAGEFGPFLYSGRVALELGPSHDVAGVRTGSAFGFAAAAGVRVPRLPLTVGPELFGRTVFGGPDSFVKATTSLEGLIGAHVTRDELRFGLGVGTAFTSAIGDPTFRMVATMEFAPEPPSRTQSATP